MNILVAADPGNLERLNVKCGKSDAKACRELSVALGKLTDQALLAKIAADSRLGWVRSTAVGKLTDQAVLTKFAAEEEDPYVREAAVGNLTDQTALAKFAV
jgi:hypothetical protein